MGRCGAPCTGAQSPEEYAAVAAVFAGGRRVRPRGPGRPAAGAGRRGCPPRAATRTPRCSATGSPCWSGPCAGGSGWRRWPRSPSWSPPGRTARAAGSCPWSAAAGWSPPGSRRSAALGARAPRRPAGRPPRRRPAPRTSSPPRSRRPSWCCAGWRSRAPGWSSSPAPWPARRPGTGAYSDFLARVEAGRAERDPFADRRQLALGAPDRAAPGSRGNRREARGRRAGADGASRRLGIAGVITAIVMIDAATDSIPEVAEADRRPRRRERGLLGRRRRRPDRASCGCASSTTSPRSSPGRINKVPGVLDTDTHVAFRAYSRHDLEAAFSIGFEHAD